MNKNKINKLVPYIPIAFAGIVLLIMHLTYKCSNDDLALIQNTLKPTVWEEFQSVIYNFTSWSSRILVNLPIHIFLHFHYSLWLVVEMIMWIVIMCSLSYIFIDTDDLKTKIALNIIVGSFVMMFPLNYVTSAGWITTTMTYIWPLAMGLLALTTIKRVKKLEEDETAKPLKWYSYIGYGLATLYAANQEEMSVFLTLVFGACTANIIWTCMREKKEIRSKAIILVQTLIAVCDLLLHMLTPGNSVRSSVEAAVYFTDYGTLSLIDKLEMGFSSTLYRFIFKSDYIFFFFAIFVAISVWQRQKNWIYRLISLGPVVIQLFLGYVIGEQFENKRLIFIFQQRLTDKGVISEDNFYIWKTYIPVALIFATGICLIVCFYLIYGNSFKTILASVILFGGLGARMVVAFSPTIWASCDRTFTIIYFTFIILGIMLAGEINYKRLKAFQWIIPICMLLLGTYNFWYLMTLFK